MEETDSKLIKDNIVNLVKSTKYEVLMQKCIDSKIITDRMKEIIETVNETTEEKHIALFEKIATRNQSAYNKLVDICNNYFKSAADILLPKKGTTNTFYNKNQESETLLPLTAEQCVEETKSVYLNISKPDEIRDPSEYSHYLGLSYAGILFFVNYTNDRPKANEERAWLLSLFNKLNFQIFYLENESINQVHTKIKTLKESYFTNVNCFFYIQLGIGTLNDVYFNDTSIKVSTIIDSFNNKNCHLLGIQRVFIFPSVSPSYVTNNPKKFELGFGINKMAKDKPIKLPQNVSTRSNNLYFYFEKDDNSFEESIKIFCLNVAKYAYREPLQNILKIYFNERKRAEHSDYREIVDEGCSRPFNIPNMELVRKYWGSLDNL